MLGGHPEEGHISCKRYRGGGDNAAQVRWTDRRQPHIVKGFGLMG